MIAQYITYLPKVTSGKNVIENKVKTKKDRRMRNKKWSTNEIASHLGMHYSTISRILSKDKK